MTAMQTWDVDDALSLIRRAAPFASLPQSAFDAVLDMLRRFHLIAGMSVDEHHGFDASVVPSVFPSPDFELMAHRRFELGMNNLYVFRKTH